MEGAWTSKSVRQRSERHFIHRWVGLDAIWEEGRSNLCHRPLEGGKVLLTRRTSNQDELYIQRRVDKYMHCKKETLNLREKVLETFYLSI